jgi:glutathione-independent formaldehyde dehydrogenase
VCLPFNIACGFCKNCERGQTSACLTTNPGSTGAAYGYAEMGPYQGGQAELLRVPYADFNCFVFPPGADEKQSDYVMLADIWPTRWQATELADVQAGESVVIYGSVMIVDRHRDRLRLAESIGAIPIEDSRQDPVDAVMKLTDGEGADKGCEWVGWQAHDRPGTRPPTIR